MNLSQSIAFALAMTMWATTSAHAAFVIQSDGSLLEDFNDGIVDTVTWTTSSNNEPIAASENGGELKLVQTLGFNGAYSTLSNGVSGSTPFGKGWVEPKTAGNNNHHVRMIMRRRDLNDDRVGPGLSITTNIHLRTCFDAGQYVCVFWQSLSSGPPAVDHSDIPVGTDTPTSMFRHHIRGKGQTELSVVNEYSTNPLYTYAPQWDWAGKTRYAFEINWPTETSAELRVSQILRPDQNNDLATDIVDFGIFAGDFGKSGTGDPLDSGHLTWDGSFSDFDDSGAVDIVDFGQFAGSFGQDPIVLYDRQPNWSNAACPGNDCHPDSMGVQIYAHNMGTMWVDYISIFGDSGASPSHSPEPTSLILLGVSAITLMRRRCRA